ncbi:MAG TPA: hypothetical protein VGO63_01400 [Candidatus Paceibacterota bacterium]|jgi:hypothetical protein|nr:hypothetical protein [Candidatus Paceibacterota bacterium]
MIKAGGKCHCGTLNVTLERENDEIMIVVFCKKCDDKEVKYKLAEMLAILDGKTKDDGLVNWWPTEL